MTKKEILKHEMQNKLNNFFSREFLLPKILYGNFWFNISKVLITKLRYMFFVKCAMIFLWIVQF